MTLEQLLLLKREEDYYPDYINARFNRSNFSI